MKTRCLIVDDEPLAVELIRSHAEKIDSLKVVAECHTAMDAMNILRQQSVDLMLMDIQMPQITGLEFLKSLRNPPAVIITTAYREYALDGFDLNVVDYLLKPITFERFFRAINKYYQRSAPATVTTPAAGAPETTTSPFIYVKENKKVNKIYLEDIVYIEGLNEYIGIHTANGKLVVKNSLNAIYEKLPENQFLRIHKSFIVSIPKIRSFTATSIEIGRQELPIGRSYKTEALKTLQVAEL